MTGIKVTGMDTLLRKLAALASESKQKVILRKCARAGIAPVVKAEKANCPVDKGDLKRALDRKVTGHGFKISAIAGADIDYVGDDGARPGKYDHLVIRGHVTEDGGVVPPNDFITRAADQSLAAAEQKYGDKLKTEIEKLATE
jgi:hypothetical protein